MDQTTRIFWGAVAGAAVVVSAVLVVVLRDSGDGGTAAEQPAGTTPAVQPVVVRSAVLGPPMEFGSVVVTDHVLRVSPAGYAVEVRYPVVSGIADPARQERINARLRAPADEAMAGLVAGFGRYPAGSGGSATVSADTSVIGKFVTVQFESVTHHPGAESIERGADAITVRLDTAAPVTASAMFTADGRSDRGQRANRARAPAAGQLRRLRGGRRRGSGGGRRPDQGRRRRFGQRGRGRSRVHLSRQRGRAGAVRFRPGAADLPEPGPPRRPGAGGARHRFAVGSAAPRRPIPE